MRDTIELARALALNDSGYRYEFSLEKLKAFEALVRADEREACAKKTEEFARKWWKIHCDSNLHYSSTLKAHQDFCALQAAIRARSKP
jgi:hypothetical protein